jgi:LAO/AO transport system kinase
MILEVETKRSERGANRETGRSRLKRRAALALRSTRRDEVPGLKRGLIELADLILVNKADGDLADHAPPPTTPTRCASAPGADRVECAGAGGVGADRVRDRRGVARYDRFRAAPHRRVSRPGREDQVAVGSRTPAAAAQSLLATFLGKS